MELLASLAVLACPIAMGAMMWFMMRSGRRSSGPTRPQVPPSLEALQEERRRLNEEIERAEGAHDR